MKIISWGEARNEGAKEALDIIIEVLEKAEPKIAFIGIIEVAKQLRKKYK